MTEPLSTPAAQGTVADALLKHFGDSNRTTLTAREAGRQAANVARQVLAAAPPPEALPASGVDYDRGRRDMLNSILALNPAVAAKMAYWEEREPDPLGRLPFNVALWVTEVAAQLGIEPKDDALSAWKAPAALTSAPAPGDRT